MASRSGRPTKRKAHLSFNRKNTKRKVEHSILPSKKQLLVDYSIGKFFLVYASMWSKLLQNIKCSECGEHLCRIFWCDSAIFTNNIEVYILQLGGRRELFKQSYIRKTHCSYLVNESIVNSVNFIGLGFAALEWLCAIMNMNRLSKNVFQLQLKVQHKEDSTFKDIVLRTAL